LGENRGEDIFLISKTYPKRKVGTTLKQTGWKMIHAKQRWDHRSYTNLKVKKGCKTNQG
jgi:hypothetical protein